jgi:NADH:ubiquinone oxidoreductase subunit 3 (subunit A)
MTATQVLYHPLTVFAVCLLCGWLLYQFGRAISPATQAVGSKLRTYACGEEAPAKSFPTAYHLFHAAFIFTLLDVLALVIGTVPRGVPLLLGAGYVVVGLTAIIILFKD